MSSELKNNHISFSKLFHRSHIYEDIEVPAISGLGAEENWVGETEIRLVIRSSQLGYKETSTFYRNWCDFLKTHLEQKEIVRQHPVILSFLCTKLNFALHPPFKVLSLKIKLWQSDGGRQKSRNSFVFSRDICFALQ